MVLDSSFTWNSEEHVANCSLRAVCTVGITTLAPTAPTKAATSSWCWNSCHRINSNASGWYSSFTVGPTFGSACQSLSPVDNSVDRLLLLPIDMLHLIFLISSFLVFLFFGFFIGFAIFRSLSQLFILQISHNSYFSHNS